LNRFMRVLLGCGDLGQSRDADTLRQPEPPGGLHDPSCAIQRSTRNPQ
jgi:hypothetical protein